MCRQTLSTITIAPYVYIKYTIKYPKEYTIKYANKYNATPQSMPHVKQ